VKSKQEMQHTSLGCFSSLRLAVFINLGSVGGEGEGDVGKISCMELIKGGGGWGRFFTHLSAGG